MARPRLTQAPVSRKLEWECGVWRRWRGRARHRGVRGARLQHQLVTALPEPSNLRPHGSGQCLVWWRTRAGLGRAAFSGGWPVVAVPVSPALLVRQPGPCRGLYSECRLCALICVRLPPLSLCHCAGVSVSRPLAQLFTPLYTLLTHYRHHQPGCWQKLSLMVSWSIIRYLA